MLSEQELIAYLEHALPPAERARVEAELERDAAGRRQLVAQAGMDRALRAALGGRAADERVKQSVLAVVRGGSEEVIKQQVLAETALIPRARRRDSAAPSGLSAMLDSLFATLRPPAAIGVVAVCVLLAGVGLWLRSSPGGRAELPSQVQATGAMTVRHGISSPMSPHYLARVGDEIQVGATNSASVRFADGTALHLEPGARFILGPPAKAARAGGKQITLLAGTLAAEVKPQPPRRPLLVHTPHALATVVGTEFALVVDARHTELEVTHGLVRLADGRGANAVSVAAGEQSAAGSNTAPRAAVSARNPFRHPFAADSPWNCPLGDGARFEPVRARSFVAAGPLTNVLIPRRPLRGGPANPLRGVWVEGERRADIRLVENVPVPQGVETFVLMQAGRRFALELFNVRTRADGDLDVGAFAWLDLAGPGVGEPLNGIRPFGFSALGGIIREGEFQSGIRHALAARVDKSRINVRPPGGGVCVWPATNAMRFAPSGGDDAGNLHIGTLLALPPDVKVEELDLAPFALALARAMQDYGVYVTGPGPRPFALASEAREDVRAADAALSRLVPLLQVVVNNTPVTPGGGGVPRRPLAAAFPVR